MTTKTIEIWTMYDHPADYPNSFIARKFINAQPTNEVIVGQSVKEIRDILATKDLRHFGRSPDDDSIIIENWI